MASLKRIASAELWPLFQTLHFNSNALLSLHCFSNDNGNGPLVSPWGLAQYHMGQFGFSEFCFLSSTLKCSSSSLSSINWTSEGPSLFNFDSWMTVASSCLLLQETNVSEHGCSFGRMDWCCSWWVWDFAADIQDFLAKSLQVGTSKCCCFSEIVGTSTWHSSTSTAEDQVRI